MRHCSNDGKAIDPAPSLGCIHRGLGLRIGRYGLRKTASEYRFSSGVAQWPISIEAAIVASAVVCAVLVHVAT